MTRIEFLVCSICSMPVRIGDKVTIKCVRFTRDGEPVSNITHDACVAVEVEKLRLAIEAFQ